jgi:hypothetical protein
MIRIYLFLLALTTLHASEALSNFDFTNEAAVKEWIAVHDLAR